METRETLYNQLVSSCPEVDFQLIKEHLARAGDDYFNRFSTDEICGHIRALSKLLEDSPVEVLCSISENNTISCTVFSFDKPFVFSLITGVLASTGFNILSGEVFTWSKSKQKTTRAFVQKRATFRSVSDNPVKRRKIVDYFVGTIPESLDFQQWERLLTERFIKIFTRVEKGAEEDLTMARQQVNYMVVRRLMLAKTQKEPFLFPMEIEADLAHESCTRFRVLSQDTPFFLYSLSNALSLQNLSIEHVDITTVNNKIQDTIDITDRAGNKIDTDDTIDRIKLSVLLTKQFTYFLSNSPDPYSALIRFEQIVKDIVAFPEKDRFVRHLSEPKILEGLARLLGASDYLWEDFIRLQYESLVPMLGTEVEEKQFCEPAETIPDRLESACSGITDYDSYKKALNDFKDKEIYLIDLDYILHSSITFDELAGRLTLLAEVVVKKTFDYAFSFLVSRYGEPKTVGGIPAKYAVLGLGKLGGAALGYASDIELLIVYSDNGRTVGDESITNAEFFDLLVKKTQDIIQTKRDGIFAVDLQLRPYGNDGPLACSLESFCRYYIKDGPAHSYERLALVRLRAFGGDVDLGARIERLRDEYIYTTKSINPQEIRALREKQFREKVKNGQSNAKFSQGALVDLEYDVQLLQVIYGSDNPQLRIPRIREALDILASIGVLEPDEGMQLVAAYDFLRILINGLRMLRGSAEDLFLPPQDSDEFEHCARRMGYAEKTGLTASQQVHTEFEMHTARIRAFVERHFGRDSLPGPPGGNIADIILSESISQDPANRILTQAGFKNPARALTNIKKMTATAETKDIFSHLAVLAIDMLRHKPDPDMAINNWQRLTERITAQKDHYNELLSQPMRLDILLSIFSSSQWLADMLILNPDFFDWVTTPKILHGERTQAEIESEIRGIAVSCESDDEWLDALRRFRKREILRIGTRDICCKVPMRTIMADLSALAGAVVQVTLEEAWEQVVAEHVVSEDDIDVLSSSFCIIAFGKLGGNELNYSSDIDLLGIYDVPDAEVRYEPAILNKMYSQLMEKLCSNLSNHTTEGYAYRVDMRLRPYGQAGTLALSVKKLSEYYRKTAAQWELQALLKMRPLAGNLVIGRNFSYEITELLAGTVDEAVIVKSIEHMRSLAVKQLHRAPVRGIDVKNDRGGIRDIEFLVQGLQLIHASANPQLITSNTLDALSILGKTGILPFEVVQKLEQSYLFFRRIEHFLQLLEDRQVHILPQSNEEKEVLAKRVLGSHTQLQEFDRMLTDAFKEVHTLYSEYLLSRAQKK